jgi:hypothetical protein
VNATRLAIIDTEGFGEPLGLGLGDGMATMLLHVTISGRPPCCDRQKTGHVRTRTTKPINSATAKIPRVLCGAFMILDLPPTI